MKAKYTVHVKRAKNKEFFWKIIHRNGNEICRSSETYKRQGKAITALKNLIDAFNVDQVVWDIDIPPLKR